MSILYERHVIVLQKILSLDQHENNYIDHFALISSRDVFEVVVPVNKLLARLENILLEDMPVLFYIDVMHSKVATLYQIRTT